LSGRANRNLKKEDKPVNEVQNLDKKRVCDISADGTVVEIRRKDCVTRITANPDGTLNITQERITSAA
jgi:hypothetical protein